MSWRSAIGWITLFALLALIGSGALRSDNGGDSEPANGKDVNGTVVRVVDGDTIKVRLDRGDTETVRYIGVDTPETVKPGEPVQCFGKAASTYNKRLVEGRPVRLRIGRERLDRYDRLLAYVYLRSSGAFVNELLVQRGYARTLTISPNTDLAGRFAKLQRRAQRDRIGLWAACPNP
jgi:micrococcal nuclease